MLVWCDKQQRKLLLREVSKVTIFGLDMHQRARKRAEWKHTDLCQKLCVKYKGDAVMIQSENLSQKPWKDKAK